MADENNKQDKPDKSDKPTRNGNGKGPGNNRNPQNLVSRGVFGWLMLIGLAIVVFILLAGTQNQATTLSWNEFYTLAQEDKFDGSVIAEDDRIVGKLKEGAASGLPEDAQGAERVATNISPHTKALYISLLQEVGQDSEEKTGGSALFLILIQWAPFLVIALLVYFFFIRSLRNAGGGPGMLGSFGRSKHKVVTKEHSNITLSDVAGIEEAKDEVGEIIEFLKNPKKFQRLGGRVPRGVLLVGSPGCGKTLLAKAVAGEAEVPFFSISGSDFVEMFVGVGASRVRDLFKQAKENSPCIIFLDEIDAVGRRRGSGFSSGGHDEREQTLNAILVEMDGFETNDQVIVMAATNRGDILDPALTRPGRFDRQIQVPLPDVVGRMEILKVHSRRIKMSPDVDLEKLARGTPMFSGAELAAIINEAAIGATLGDKEFVEMEDLEEARDKVRFGRARKSHKVEEDERELTAYHEAGHAVSQYLLEDSDPLHKVTIIPRGPTGGATFSLPEKDRHTYGLKWIAATMRIMCGGRIAEQKQVGDVSSGASGDIRQVTAMARHMILEWGMSDKLGFVDYSTSDSQESMISERNYSEETARVVDEEVRRLIDEAYADCKQLLEDNWEKVDAIAQALLVHETLNYAEVDRLMKGEKLSKPTVGELLKAEQEKESKSEISTPAPGVSPEDGESDDAPGAMPSPA